LRQIVTDATGDKPVFVFARELLAIGCGARVGCSVRVTFHRDRGQGNGRTFGKPLLEMVILRLTFRNADPPAVIVNHNGSMVRVVERRCRTIESGVVEIPLGRRKLPDEFVEIVPVLLVASLAVAK